VSEYGVVRDHVSELTLGRFGFVQTAAFLMAGLGTLGLAVAIRRLTAGSRGSLTGSLLVGMYGAGAVLSAIFPTDRSIVGDGVLEVGKYCPDALWEIAESLIPAAPVQGGGRRRIDDRAVRRPPLPTWGIRPRAPSRVGAERRHRPGWSHRAARL
jgi:hypothetical protein